MDKGRRNEITKLKYKKRIQKWVTGLDIYIDKKGNRIHKPKSTDIIKDNGFQFLKSTSTPCSCPMCQGKSYSRKIKHKECEF